MDRANASSRLFDDSSRAFRSELGNPTEEDAEILTFEILHHEKAGCSVASEIEHANDVLIGQCSSSTCLTFKP
jgi:hypothetical protein